MFSSLLESCTLGRQPGDSPPPSGRLVRESSDEQSNDYDYVSGDPIGSLDLDGRAKVPFCDQLKRSDYKDSGGAPGVFASVTSRSTGKGTGRIDWNFQVLQGRGLERQYQSNTVTVREVRRGWRDRQVGRKANGYMFGSPAKGTYNHGSLSSLRSAQTYVITWEWLGSNGSWNNVALSKITVRCKCR